MFTDNHFKKGHDKGQKCVFRLMAYANKTQKSTVVILHNIRVEIEP